MKFTYALIAGGLVAALPVRAVYAPIPEQEQGKDWSVNVTAGIAYDSNIFGGATDAINSMVYTVAPKVVYNASLTDQTFFSGSYALTLDDIERRPGTKLLDSHDLNLRLAHAFNKESILDLSNDFMVARNPQSLLNGEPVNADQSFWREQFDGHYTVPLTPKIGGEAKLRIADTRYRNATLGRMLDRIENLYGLAGNYAILPELKAVAEYRHQDEYYWTEGENKNKRSEYLMTGFDYAAARKLTLSGRFGAEWRHRANAENATAPYAEMSGRYEYAERSFITGGYAYTFDESSDPARFTDEKVNRFFVSAQHAVTALIVLSGSVDIEPAVLQGRLGQPNLNETTNRVGVAATYAPTKNWTITASYDLDRTHSDDPSRAVERHRAGLTVGYTF